MTIYYRHEENKPACVASLYLREHKHIHIKKWNNRKQSLTDYGVRDVDYIRKQYASDIVQLFYYDNDNNNAFLILRS